MILTGLKKRTRKAFGIRKKEKDSDSTGSPDKDKSKKANGAPNGFYGEIDWDRYNSPDVDDEGYNSPAPKVNTLLSSSESEGEEEHGKKFKIKIKPLTANSGNCTVSTMDELKASVGTLAISPSPLVRLAVIVRGYGSASVCQDAPLSDPSGGASMPDLDSVFGPVETPRSGSDVVQWSWVSFSEGSPARPPPPDEPAPSPPLSSSPADSPPTSPLNLPPPPLHSIPPPDSPPPPPPLDSPLKYMSGSGCFVSPQARPFSPPIHSWSPPPFAPLARAESTSSISSVTSLSGPQQMCSRGPSPLTMVPQDTLPVAAAFTETISAYFKGADPTKCLVKIAGEMVLSFPAGITRHFSTHPSPPVLTFTISQYSRLEQVLPNPQLLCCDTTPPTGDSKEFWVNMSNLLSHLKKVAEQRPQATYYNVDMLKYQVFTQGIQSTPLNLAVSWRGDASSTDLRIDYKYNTEAMPTPTPLTNIHFIAAVDGGVNKLQAMLPPATWNPETQKITWKIPELSQRSENGGVGALLARFQLAEGPSRPSQLAVQFTSEGSTLSGCDFQLVGSGYRLSLVKKRFSAGMSFMKSTVPTRCLKYLNF
uniref:SH3GL interacting endocytic adaptor 1 n=2 Tax=Cyprinus carpio TaxID=7962 RepID=A0A8C2JUY3_CYPCA